MSDRAEFVLVGLFVIVGAAIMCLVVVALTQHHLASRAVARAERARRVRREASREGSK